MYNRKGGSVFVTWLLVLCILFNFMGCAANTDDDLDDGSTSQTILEDVTDDDSEDPSENTSKDSSESVTKDVSKGTNLDSVPAYSGKKYITLNGNNPTFTKAEYTTKSFERYSNLDALGRCGVAYACIGLDIMPTGERGEIGQVKPTGWHTVKYDIVDGKYLYNRCHLIGWQLTGENANTRNLITGTRYFNVDGMLPFENMVDDYIEETGNHVLYRVTPDFRGSELVARGVQIEAYSVEDDGDGICFNVYIYNIQPGVTIDYATGKSSLSASPGTTAVSTTKVTTNASTTISNVTYIGNRNSKKFHKPTCGSVKNMNEGNKVFFYCSRAEVVGDGYTPCGNCNP